MDIKESKIDAKVTFIDRRSGRQLSGPHLAIVHLFEHDYMGVTFWYGVADVYYSPSELKKAAVEKGVEDADGYHPGFCRIRLDFDDRRYGLATVRGGTTLSESRQDMYAGIVFVYESGLLGS